MLVKNPNTAMAHADATTKRARRPDAADLPTAWPPPRSSA
jgi:hypothetical protein